MQDALKWGWSLTRVAPGPRQGWQWPPPLPPAGAAGCAGKSALAPHATGAGEDAPPSRPTPLDYPTGQEKRRYWATLNGRRRQRLRLCGLKADPGRPGEAAGGWGNGLGVPRCWCPQAQRQWQQCPEGESGARAAILSTPCELTSARRASVCTWGEPAPLQGRAVPMARAPAGPPYPSLGVS